jgi:prevent-host-death family protein
MLMVNIVDAKAKLSEYLDAVSRGEHVVICNRNRPVAELRPVAGAPAARRLGTASGEVTVPDSFNDPLPDDLLDAFADRLLDVSNEVYLSAASAWEIAIKVGTGHLKLKDDPDRFVPRHRAASGFAPLPIDEESALHVWRLPNLHRDPFDRMLVSQAIVHGLTILTPDPLVTQYPARTAW